MATVYESFQEMKIQMIHLKNRKIFKPKSAMKSHVISLRWLNGRNGLTGLNVALRVM